MSVFSLEICVDSVESAIAAQKGGANRIELCGHLLTGGVTPNIALFHAVKEHTDLPINVLIRPRFGDFLYSDFEFDMMLKEIEYFAKNGANAVVIGALCEDGSIDAEKIKKMMDKASGIDITLHRAFDVCKDSFQAMQLCEELGIQTVLTSGQKDRCIDGIALLSQLARSFSKTQIMAGSGVTPSVIEHFLECTDIRNFHMSAKKAVNSKMKFRNPEVNMGLKGISEYEIWQTDESVVRLARTILDKQETILKLPN